MALSRLLRAISLISLLFSDLSLYLVFLSRSKALSTALILCLSAFAALFRGPLLTLLLYHSISFKTADSKTSRQREGERGAGLSLQPSAGALRSFSPSPLSSSDFFSIFPFCMSISLSIYCSLYLACLISHRGREPWGREAKAKAEAEEQ